jgi:hypothetical protein
MKLLTSLTASRDGSLVDATDENLIHDAMAAHALMQAMEDAGRYNFRREWIEKRADEIMTGWHFDSGEDA